MKQFILSIDQGTTSSRAILFDHEGHVCSMAQREVECLFPKPGWVEADAIGIWVSVIDVVNEVLVKANVTMDCVHSIGITNQRETTVVWDKETGMPVYHAVVWQSRQSSSICDSFEEQKDYIHEKTGLLINPFFSASKIRFILDHIQNGQKRAEKGELLFGTVDSWLVYKMTKGKVHATDVSNASRTMLYNIFENKWDEDLLKMFNIPSCMLPKVLPSSYNYGKASFFSNDVPICAVVGDQQAALFGQTCFEVGESKNTYGTGCFMLMNTGSEPVLSKSGLLTTIAWQVNGKVTYALEGSVFVGGAVVQWLRDQMRLLHDASESEKCALEVKDTNGMYFVPAFVGLGTPYWDDDARGSAFGMTRGTNKNHFIRACLEAIAYQCKDVFEVMKNETHHELKNLKVDGGATKNKFLMQFQSDILHTEIKLPTCLETTALGAAYLAGLASKFYKDIDEIKSIHSYQAVYKPKMDQKTIEEKYGGWKTAVKATRTFK